MPTPAAAPGALLLAAALLSTGCFSLAGGPLPGTAAADAPPGVLGSMSVSSPLLGNATVAPTA